jgi:hypothetical protein
MAESIHSKRTKVATIFRYVTKAPAPGICFLALVGPCLKHRGHDKVLFDEEKPRAELIRGKRNELSV